MTDASKILFSSDDNGQDKLYEPMFNLNGNSSLIDEPKNNIQIIKYTTIANSMNIPVETVGCMIGSDEAALVYTGPERPAYIYYKDIRIPKARIRWNLGHEVAHFCCGHHLIEHRVKCSGLKMSKLDAVRIEAEANAFIRAMHAPLELVIAFMGHYNIYYKVGIFTILRSIFQMSIPAAYYYADQILSRRITQLVIPDNATPYEDFYRNFISQFGQDVFYALLRRYESEYSMFATDQYRQTQPGYRIPYSESISAIVGRVLPKQNESFETA